MSVVALTLAMTVQGPVAAESSSPSPGSDAAAPSPSGFLKWSKSDHGDGFDQGPLLNDLVVGSDGRVLLLGAIEDGDKVTPAVWGSDDGSTWSRLPGDLPAGSVAQAGVATDDGFLIVTTSDVPDAGKLFRSDGTDLVPIDTPSGSLMAISRSPAGLHALEDADTPVVWTSTDDAATWTSSALDPAVAQHIAVTDDGTVVVLGRVDAGEDLAAPTAWSSTDGGATWTPSTLPVDPGPWLVRALEWTPIGLVARVVDASTDDVTGVDLVSQDGVTWQRALETPGWGAVGTAGTEALIYSPDAWWHSGDGVTWTKAWWPTLAGFDMAASGVLPDGRVIAAGVSSGAAPAPAATFIGTPPSQDRPTAPPAPDGSAAPG
jgi:hypothetical protein